MELTDETEKREEFFYEENGDDAKQDGISAGSRHDGNGVGGRSGGLCVRTGVGDSAVGGKYGDHGDEPGENQAEPDIAEITYSVYSQAADASTCQSENQTDLDAVLALLKEKGIADTSVQTSGLGLNPIYDWDNGKKITGYEMTTEVVVSDVAIEDAGRSSAIRLMRVSIRSIRSSTSAAILMRFIRKRSKKPLSRRA